MYSFKEMSKFEGERCLSYLEVQMEDMGCKIKQIWVRIPSCGSCRAGDEEKLAQTLHTAKRRPSSAPTRQGSIALLHVFEIIAKIFL